MTVPVVRATLEPFPPGERCVFAIAAWDGFIDLEMN
jgi:hypothetical protein